MTATKEIFNTITENLKDFDARLLADELVWARKRIAAVAEFKANHRDENGKIRLEVSMYYQMLFSIAGGKTWYSIFKGRSWSMIEEVMICNNKSRADKRNASIAKKLNDAGITAVTSTKVAYNQNGFDGRFVVETDAGQRVVSIDTVFAGGYNIQCAHLRVLVKVK